MSCFFHILGISNTHLLNVVPKQNYYIEVVLPQFKQVHNLNATLHGSTVFYLMNTSISLYNFPVLTLGHDTVLQCQQR